MQFTVCARARFKDKEISEHNVAQSFEVGDMEAAIGSAVIQVMDSVRKLGQSFHDSDWSVVITFE